MVEKVQRMLLLSWCIVVLKATATVTEAEPEANNGSKKIRVAECDQLLQDVYEMIKKNAGENSRKLKLEDFSWGIFSGTNGRLQGFDSIDITLLNKSTIFGLLPNSSGSDGFNTSSEFTLPTLRATWEKSVCLGYSCAITIELKNVVFVLRTLFSAAKQCTMDHLAYLKTYENAKCRVNYVKSWPFSISIVEATVKLLSQVLNTNTFRDIIKDNVNYGLLQLPLFSSKDVHKLCDAYKKLLD